MEEEGKRSNIRLVGNRRRNEKVYVPPVVFDDVVDVVEPARARLVERGGQYLP